MRSYAYHPDFGQVIPYEFKSLPEDPDGQVNVALDQILSWAREDVNHPLVQEAAREALRRGYDPRLSYARQCINGMWLLLKSTLRFKEDQDLANALAVKDPRKDDVVEVIIRPADLARMVAERGQGREDCDGFEGYAAALLGALGLPCSIVAASADPDAPRRFSHVYMAVYADGQRIPVDFSHGPYPGWECPNTGRVKEYPMYPRFTILNALLPVTVTLAMLWLTTRYTVERGTIQ